MKFKTRRFLFLLILVTLVSPLPFLGKVLIAVPAVQALLLDFDEWTQERGVTHG